MAKDLVLFTLKKNTLLDCGNSGTTARLLIGLLSTNPDIQVKIKGDNSLNKRNKLNFLTTSYPKFITKKYNLPKNKIKSVIIIELFVRGLRQINKYLNKIRLNIHPAVILDWVTDFIYSYFYINNSDYYIIGFGGSFCKLIKKAKKIISRRFIF